MTDTMVGGELRRKMAVIRKKPVRGLKPVSDVGMCFKLTRFDPFCGVRRKRYDVPVEVHVDSDYELRVMGRKEVLPSVEDL